MDLKQELQKIGIFLNDAVIDYINQYCDNEIVRAKEKQREKDISSAVCAFVELKDPGKQMRLLQRKRRQQLEALGFPVFCVDRPEQIQPAIDALVHWNPGEPIPQGIGARIPDMPQVTLPESEVMPK